jgi:microcystin-dependent protein
MSEPFIGEIRMAGFNFAPKGFALCNGQILAIAQNQALFAILGTTYGGNGQTTFGLPDFRGRTPISSGTSQQGTFALGQAGGEAAHTLGPTEMPLHTHQLTGATAPNATQRNPENNLYGVAQKSGNFSLYTSSPGPQMNLAVTGHMGGGQPHNNMQPYLVISFYIALNGIFPSRN